MPLTILAPFCTILAGKWHLGEGVGKVCSVGDPVALGCGCQHRKCDIRNPCMLSSQTKPEGCGET